MKDRVKQVQEHYRLSQKQFAIELGVAEATISSVYRGRTAPTNNLIQAVHNTYPAVNINWLMFGEGDMLLPLTAETAVPPTVAILPDDQTSVDGQVDLFGQNVGKQTSDITPRIDSADTRHTAQSGQNPSVFSARPAELQLAEALSLLKKTNEIDKPVRKIKEIRVFFDDGTFETFAPSNK